MVKVNITNDKYDWKKTAKKVAKSAAIVILTGILAVYSEEPIVLGLIPVIEGLINFLKHK